MLSKLDKNGFIINQAGKNKIQAKYKPIIEEIVDLYSKRLGDNLVGVYLRGSIAEGKAIPNLSDLDSIAITEKEIPSEKLRWSAVYSKQLEKKYPFVKGIELAIVPLKTVLRSKEYFHLRVCLKTSGFCLYGKDLIPLLSPVKPGKKLALELYGDISRELRQLKAIFSGKSKNTSYLFIARPTKFWCIWTMRVLLRSGLCLVMINEPIYSRDLKTCFEEFSKSYPEYKKYMQQALYWSKNPTNDNKLLLTFLDDFGPKFINLWKINK